MGNIGSGSALAIQSFIRTRATSCSSRSPRPHGGDAALRRTSESSAGEPASPRDRSSWLSRQSTGGLRQSKGLWRQPTVPLSRGRRSIMNRGSAMDNLPRFDLRRGSNESWRSSEDLDQLKNAVEEIDEAMRQLEKRAKRAKGLTDPSYAACLALRSHPVNKFFAQEMRPDWVLPISSINEDRLLMEMGLTQEQRNQIEGLASVRMRSQLGLTPQQLAMRAIVHLAADPPAGVGHFQRRTCRWLLRPFPLGLRFSGANMSPLPCWLVGAHSVALNMSDNDLPLHLHFALFNGSGGYVIKPPEMLPADPKDSTDSDANEPSTPVGRTSQSSVATRDGDNGDDGGGESFKNQVGADRSGEEQNQTAERVDYWPPVRDRIHRITIRVISLHNLPKRGEHRPRWSTSRGACHKYAPDLSGAAAPPNDKVVSSPTISMGIYPVGGFCTLTETLPPPPNVKTELRSTSAVEARGGMNASFNATIHCIVSEPRTTFLRLAVTDRGQEVAYEAAILGRLRRGYRVLQMRSRHGTRIELCYVLVHIRFERQPNDWLTPRQVLTPLALCSNCARLTLRTHRTPTASRAEGHDRGDDQEVFECAQSNVE